MLALRGGVGSAFAATTLSLGISEMLVPGSGDGPGSKDPLERMVDRADEAVCAAKAAGRNWICVYSGEPHHPDGAE